MTPCRTTRSTLQRRTAGAAALLVAAISTLLVGACGSAPTSSGPTATPEADLPLLMVTACLDRTPSFDRQYFDNAKNMLADAIQQRVTAGGQLGANIYVTLIGHNSYASSATVRTIVIPATPGSTASSTSNNVFNNGAARETATAAAEVAASAMSKIAQQLKPDVSYLRALNPPTDSPTDILGCVSRASERFQTAPTGAQKLLILATDLQPEGTQQADKTRPLPGVHVKVIDWKCDDAATCDTLKNTWHGEFITRDQAASFSCYDPGETQAQLTNHLFDADTVGCA